MGSRARRLARELLLLRPAFDNWLRVGVAGLLWKFLPLPRRELVVRSRKGARLVVPLARDAGALHPVLQVFAFSVYESDWRLEDNPYVIDIGANIGAFTVWLSETHPGVRGACYEPDPEAFSYLQRNVRVLAVVPRPEAVAARTGTAKLVRPAAYGGTSSLRTHGAAVEGTTIDVPVVAFDEIMSGLDEPVALVKLDCEGSEYEIVLQSNPASWRLVRRAVIEYHPVDGTSPTAISERLRSLGFSLTGELRDTESSGTYWFSKL